VPITQKLIESAESLLFPEFHSHFLRGGALASNLLRWLSRSE